MNYQKLSAAASKVIMEIESDKLSYTSDGTKQSIKNQMIFIKKYADQNIDPRTKLDGNQFTYGIISSREFSSPDELEIKALIDDVSKILDKKITSNEKT